MAGHDDFAREPVRGLPERLPAGERILWQGAPDWRALARDALGIRWVAGWFAFLALWRGMTIGLERGSEDGLGVAAVYLVLGLAAAAILGLIAWVQARATVYTITDRRVVMRIGAALVVNLNLPFRALAGAALDLRRDGTGTIALALAGRTRLSYLVLWPHLRPWVLARPEPALRAIPDAERVARLLAEAAAARVTPAAAPVPAAAVAAE